MQRSIVCCGTGRPGIRACGVLVVLLLFVIQFLTGCTTSQIVGAVQKVEKGLEVSRNLIPEARNLLAGLQLDPEVTQEFSGYLDQAGPAIDDLEARCNAFIANPGSDVYQSLLNAFYDFTSKVNGKAILLTVHIKNKESQEKASAWFSRFSTGFTVGMALLQAYAPKPKPTPGSSTAAAVKSAKLDTTLLDREYAREFLVTIGYDQRTADAYVSGI